MENFLRCIGAANDETRIKILKFLILHGKSCVCELESSLGMIQSRLSRHLKILKEGGFLDVERTGSYAYYFLAPRSELHNTILEEINNIDIYINEKSVVCAS
ncbi:MAG: winged helix-turn-helix transcriptional regulator [Campylobacteraceae bacterium]|jgi:ArsR family transcriptional regulator|nr:winged helix-turn-helix transcriptional regulator [Campylobacteraceae bacterium]